MSEFVEFTEYKEIKPETLPPTQHHVKDTLAWDGWGDEEDRQRFYRLPGVDAPALEKKAATAPDTVASRVSTPEKAIGDGWGSPTT